MDFGASFDDVLKQEISDIEVGRQYRGVVSPGSTVTSDMFGLALSGGDLRSAIFFLGVLQQLAARRLLQHVDYLSTVSGGGYIGSWLLSWIKNSSLNTVMEKLRPRHYPEAPQVTSLRNCSQYTLQQIRFFDLDSWTFMISSISMTILNIGLIAIGIAGVTLSVRGLVQAVLVGPVYVPSLNSLLACCALLPLILAIGHSLNRIGHAYTLPNRAATQHALTTGTLLAECISFSLLSAVIYSVPFATGSVLSSGPWTRMGFPFLTLFTALLLQRLYGRSAWRRQPQRTRSANALYRFSSYLVGPAIQAFMISTLPEAISFLFSDQSPSHPWVVLTAGPPFILIVIAVGIVTQIGSPDADLLDGARDWLSRLRAYLLLVAAFWVILFAVAVWIPWAVISLNASKQLGTSAVLVTIGTLITSNSKFLLSFVSQTPAALRKLGQFVIAYALLAGLFTVVPLGVHFALVRNLIVPPEYDTCDQLSGRGWRWLSCRYWNQLNATEWFVKDGNQRWVLSGLVPFTCCVGGALVLLSIMSGKRSSVQEFYKRHLITYYLGASRYPDRQPDPFTGFDDLDDQDLASFTPKRGYYGPLPVLNASAKIHAGGKLKRKPREGYYVPFVFTPVYSGLNVSIQHPDISTGDEANKALISHDTNTLVGYRPTDKLNGNGIKLGTAMAISGADRSQTLSSASKSLVLNFLLTIFNLRLNWRIANPVDGAYHRNAPPFSLLYSIADLFGVGDLDSKCVNLSDGGYFENMGIYELVRRRCKYIICCDAERDAEMTFQGIANSIQLCRIHFGVDIDLSLNHVRQNDGLSGVHGAIGRIRYPEPDCTPGYLVYLKCSLTGDEPIDVLAYRNKESAFPQVVSADRSSSDQEFEAYRQLGLHVADAMLSVADIGDGSATARETFFESLFQRWTMGTDQPDRKKEIEFFTTDC